MINCPSHIFVGAFVPTVTPSEICVIGLDIIGVALSDLLLLFGGQPQEQLFRNFAGNLEIDVDYLRRLAAITLAPNMRTIERVS